MWRHFAELIRKQIDSGTGESLRPPGTVALRARQRTKPGGRVRTEDIGAASIGLRRVLVEAGKLVDHAPRQRLIDHRVVGTAQSTAQIFQELGHVPRTAQARPEFQARSTV